MQENGADIMTQQWLQQLATDATDGNADSRGSSAMRSDQHGERERMAMLAACAAAHEAPAGVSLAQLPPCEGCLVGTHMLQGCRQAAKHGQQASRAAVQAVPAVRGLVGPARGS